MIITICGQAGSGKSSVAKLLASKLGYKHYSMGDIRRKAAYERGMTLAELNELGEKDPSTDKFADDIQEKLGKEEDNFVVDGRTCFHFIPHSIKIHLHADLDERAGRAMKDERVSERFSTTEDCREALVKRDESDVMRYGKWYGINPNDKGNYDFWISTTDLTLDGVVDRILELIKEHRK